MSLVYHSIVSKFSTNSSSQNIFAANRKLFDYNKSEVLFPHSIECLAKSQKKNEKKIERKKKKKLKKNIENCLWLQTFPIEEKAISYFE